MKNTEFRLLNYVEYLNWSENGTPAYFMIRDIYRDEGKVSLSNGAIMLPSPSMDMIKPIQLTEEWLLKFGFPESDLENGKILVVGESFDNVIGYTIRALSPNVVIKYVHQLQNLYFALTQTELVVTTTPKTQPTKQKTE